MREMRKVKLTADIESRLQKLLLSPPLVGGLEVILSVYMSDCHEKNNCFSYLKYSSNTKN
ncbi:uncharacterized protein PHALS_15344 [Plasmopara halstedii]|uniref:Uncharacterized protein n=1 Tax=Plasmopara halstedii TaxID=4781 RepID=A0A0N7L4K3_PLAHL|nr:uncharacterized protein PHALS_15344 [Plasmopara halstedii]CEG38915.1 hypothetical protein PHALS_15344 [Plasmopara halstedii]|eukprot:XP_024575284.1 hypothetical protein PHALS_15344 [Plasmopara halstedii]